MKNFRGSSIASLPFDHLTDTGFQLQASAMVIPKTTQVVCVRLEDFGDDGKPSDVRAGFSVFPWKNQTVRWNTELIRLESFAGRLRGRALCQWAAAVRSSTPTSK